MGWPTHRCWPSADDAIHLIDHFSFTWTWQRTVCTSQQQMKCELVKASVAEKENGQKSSWWCNASPAIDLATCHRPRTSKASSCSWPSHPVVLSHPPVRWGEGTESHCSKIKSPWSYWRRTQWSQNSREQHWACCRIVSQERQTSGKMPVELNVIRWWQGLKLWLNDLNKVWEVKTWPLLQ